MYQQVHERARDPPFNELSIIRRRRSDRLPTKQSKARSTEKRSPIRVCYIAPYCEPWRGKKYIVADVTESFPKPPEEINVTTALLLDATDVVADGAGIRFDIEEKDGRDFIFRKDGEEVASRRHRTLLHPQRIIRYTDPTKPIAHIKRSFERPFKQGGARYKWHGGDSLAKLRKYDARGRTIVSQTYMPSSTTGRLLVFDEREVDELAILYSTKMRDDFSRIGGVSSDGPLVVPEDADARADISRSRY